MRHLRALAAASLLVALAGCAESSEAGSGGAGHNEADVSFAGDMIQHHAQALQMVDLTMGRDLDPEVGALADDIRAAQTPEIEKMADWLEEWDEPVPETVRDHANAHGDGTAMEHGTDVPGMMGAEEMESLEKASDAEFQDLWLEMMIEHHQGAVEMAPEEQEAGESAQATDLAEDIETTQTQEIETMEGLLGR